jgi:hypothetical protein
MDDEALQEWKGHFDIEDDAIVVLKYLISTNIGRVSPTNAGDPFPQALEPWIERFNIPRDAVTVLDYLIFNQRSCAIPGTSLVPDIHESDTQDTNLPPSHNTENGYSLVFQPRVSASDTTLPEEGIPEMRTFDQAIADQAAVYIDRPFPDTVDLEIFDLESGFSSPAIYSPFPNDCFNFEGPLATQSLLGLPPNMALISDISEDFCERTRILGEETVKGKPCIKCWLDKKKVSPLYLTRQISCSPHANSAAAMVRISAADVSLLESLCHSAYASESVLQMRLSSLNVSSPGCRQRVKANPL